MVFSSLKRNPFISAIDVYCIGESRWLFSLLHQIDFCLPPYYSSFMRSYSIRFHPSSASQKTYSLTRPSSLQRTPAIRREAIKSELWGLRTGQAQSSIYLISVLDFTGACVPASPPSAHRFSASHSSRGGHFVVCRLLSKWSSRSDKTRHFRSLNPIVLGLLQGLTSG